MTTERHADGCFAKTGGECGGFQDCTPASRREGLRAVVQVEGTDPRVPYIVRAVLERDYRHLGVTNVSTSTGGGALRMTLLVLTPVPGCTPGDLGEQILRLAGERDINVLSMETEVVAV